MHVCQLVGLNNFFDLELVETIHTLLSEWGVAVCVNL